MQRDMKTATMLFRRVFLTMADMSFPFPAGNKHWEEMIFLARSKNT